MSTLPAHWPFEIFHRSTIARGRVEPEHVAGAVVVEVAEAGRLVAGRMRADIRAAGPLAVRELPDVDVAVRRIVPGEIARSRRH